MKLLAAIVVFSMLSILAYSAELAKQGGVSAEVSEVHAKVITPASNALFQAESSLPSTTQEWDKIRARAADLEQAAARLASRDLAKDQGRWIEFALALKNQAKQAALAAERRDQDALVIANGDIVAVCEDCHAKYRDAGRSMRQ